MMNVSEELKDIVCHAKRLLTANADMGLEPPRFSRVPAAPADVRPPRLNTLEELKSFINDCRRCKLCRGRTNLVFGEGSSRARLLFVGEGPGREEDAAGRPFVGEAGKLLTRIIENGMGIKREDVYICNVVKCRPPKNRDPEGDEIEACLPFLKKQIEIIGPEVICTLGRIAAQGLMGRAFGINRERGNWFSFMDIPVMATFHPAYLLYNPPAKRQVWEDVQKIMTLMGLEVKDNG
jgi:uracil-DNA glycosylase family 4